MATPIESKVKMTPRQLYLTRTLMRWSVTDPNKWITQKEICDGYPIEVYSDGYKYNPRKNTTDCCIGIWEDLEFIEKNELFPFVIVKYRYTYKIATQEEAESYVRKEMIDGLKKLKRAWRVVNSMKLNGQGTLFDKWLNEQVKESSFETTLIEGDK